MSIEAAFVLPVILLVVLSVFEVVALSVTKLELTAAAREGARIAATVPDPARAVAAVRATLGDPLGSEVVVSVVRPAVVGRLAEVTVTARARLRSPILSGVSVPVVARSAMAVEP